MNELRMLLAETLLGWAIAVAPKNNEGVYLQILLSTYFQDKINSSIKPFNKKEFLVSAEKAEKIFKKEGRL